MRTIVSVLLAACSLSTLAAEEACGTGQLSHAQEVECLLREYKSTDALLRQKVKQLLQNASTIDVGFSQAELIKAQRDKVTGAIRQADQHWRAALEAECDVLVAASFATGNGAMDGALECRIARTSDRIKQLSVSEPYSWLWGR